MADAEDHELLTEPTHRDVSSATPSTAEAPSVTGADAEPDAASGARRPHWKIVFFICAMALLMGTIDQTIVATALPRIGTSLHSSLNWVGWTITIYSLGQIITMPFAGKMSDLLGRKNLFVGSLILFAVSSIACGLATNVDMLIPFRLVQAVGAGAFVPSTMGIVADHFGHDRDRGIGMFASIVPAGGLIGPVVGGFITQYWTWRGIFFINIPLAILLIVLAVRFIAPTEPREVGELDVPGVALMIVTIISAMLAITLLGEPHTSATDPAVLVPGVVALVCGWRFVRHTRRTPSPFIALQLIRGRGFLVMNVINFLVGAMTIGFSSLLPLYAERRYNIPISSAGTMLSARAVGTLALAAVATMLLRRTGYRIPLLIGSLFFAIGLFGVAISPRGGLSPYWWLAISALVTGIGVGWSAPASMNASIQLAPDQVGAISGLRGMFRQLGAITYVSVATAILTRSAHPGVVQGHIVLVLACIMTGTMGLVFLVPEHKGRW